LTEFLTVEDSLQQAAGNLQLFFFIRFFYDDQARNIFLERLGVVLTETSTPCFAWALIPNHSN
jgi:hypothetical protein